MEAANDDDEPVQMVRILGEVTADSFEPGDVVELLRVPVSVLDHGRKER